MKKINKIFHHDDTINEYLHEKIKFNINQNARIDEYIHISMTSFINK